MLFRFLLCADGQWVRDGIHTDEDIVRSVKLVGEAALFLWDRAGCDVVFRA